MNSPITGLRKLSRRPAARMVSVLLAGLVLAASITVGLRAVSADSLRRFGITEQSRMGKLIKRVAPQAKLSPVRIAAPFGTQTVTNGNNTGAGSLRNAISAAASGDTIVFSGVSTVTLTSGELLIDKDLTIDGGTNGVTITRSSGTFRIFNISSGTVLLNKLTITNGNPGSNQAGGIQNNGTLTMTDCTVSGNTSIQGGGIQNDSVLTMTGCTISGNTSTGNGGALVSFGTTTTLTNCTVSGNTASGSGGGFNMNSGALNLTNCTVANNQAPNGQGGGIYVGGTALLKNTIVVSNSASSASNIAGNNVDSSSSYNFIGTSGTGGLTNGTNGNQVTGASPQLDVLANNGGYTQTIALLSGSPALDKGAVVTGVTTDQRGQTRPFDIASVAAASGGDNSDIGAYEVQVTCATVTVSPSSLPNGTVTVSYAQTITASGGTSPYTFAVTSGTLPTGLSLASDGTLSGVPTAAGTYNFTVTATYSAGFGVNCTGSRAYTVTISPCSGSQTFTVNNAGDASDASPGNGTCATAGGVCTLRAAVEEINASSACSGTINISVSGTISLSAIGDSQYGPSALVVNKTLTINGNGVTIARNAAVTRLRQFYVSPTGNLTLNSATLQNGAALGGNGGNGNANGNGENAGGAAGLGGAIFNEGTLNINRSTLTANLAQGGNGGSSTVFTGPAAGAGGGGMGSDGGGGGGTNGGNGGSPNGGAGSTTSGTAGGNGGVGGGGGGGKGSGNGGDAGFGGGGGGGGGSGFGGNGGFGGGGGSGSGAGGGHNAGGFGGGNGGGNTPAGGGAGLGGALFNNYQGVVTITNSTFSANTVTGGSGVNNGSAFGSGLFNRNGTVMVVSSTFNDSVYNLGATNTDASGGASRSGASMTVDSTIITTCSNNSGTVTGPLANKNLIQNNSGCDTPAFTSNPQLGPLGNYGGLTQTHALLGGSSAIDAGDNSVTGAPYNLTTDQTGFARQVNGTVDIGAYESQLTLGPTALPNAQVSMPYSQTITASGGTPNYTFAVASGTLPTGLSLSSGGVLSGTPSSAGGPFSFIVIATDGAGKTGSRQYNTITICATLSATPGTLPNATLGNGYSQLLTGTNGTAPYTFAVTGGALPTGMALTQSGTLQGSPVTLGTSNFTITITDVNGCSSTQALSLLVNANSCSTTAITVTSNADSGAGTLRQAIADICGGGTITIQSGVGVISLSTVGDSNFGPTALAISNKAVTIVGNGAIIERNAAATNLRLFYVDATAYLNLQSVTLRNGLAKGGNGGSASGGGGGGAGLGGAIVNQGSLIVQNGTLTNNQALGGNGAAGSGSNNGGGGGGGLGFNGGSTNVGGGGGGGGRTGAGGNANGDNGGAGGLPTGGGGTNGVHGTGGGGGGTGGTGNTGGGGGGASGSGSGTGGAGGTGGIGGGGGGAGSSGFGLGVGAAGIGGFGGGGGGGGKSVNNSSAGGAGGFAGGGGGGAAGNSGGAGGFAGGTGGTGNAAGGGGGGLGGGIFNYSGSITLINSTLSGNTAQGGNGGSGSTNGSAGGSGYGGGLFNYNGTLTVVAATLNNNTVTAGTNGTPAPATPSGAAGGGIYNLGDGATARLSIVSSILANTGSGATDCSNSIINSGTTSVTGNNSLIENNNACGSPALSVDPNLGPLQDNGGLTFTHALLAGSPAIDTGDNSITSAPYSLTTDQRGIGNARKINGTVDIGAYESTSGCPTITLSPTSLPNGATGVAYTNSITASGGTSPYTFVVTSGSVPTGLTLNSNGTWSGTPSATGTFNFTVTANDNNGCPGSQAYTVTIIVPNTPPSIVAQTGISRQQGLPGSNSQIATVNDTESGPGGVTVMVTSANPSSGVTLSNITNNNGTVTADIVADCTATNASFTLQASDGSATATATLSVGVTANTPPALSYSNASVAVGSAATLTPTIPPSDNIGISTIVVQSVSPSTSPATLTVNNTTGVVTVPNNVPAGSYTVTIRATDNCGAPTGVTDATFTLTVGCVTTFTVNDLGDGTDASAGNGVCATSGGVCTLRAAIQEANALNTCSSFDINFSVTGTIQLGSALPSITKSINFNGPGADQLTVRRNTGGNYRIFAVTGSSGRTVLFSGLTISNGLLTGAGDGGGLLVSGTGAHNVTLQNCTLSGNTVDSFGGGLSNQSSTSTLNIVGSTISGNVSTGVNSGVQGSGAAIDNVGTLNITNSTISGNSATSGSDNSGGIWSSTGTVTILNSTLTNNSAVGGVAAGAIYIFSGTVTLKNSIVAGNTGPGGRDLHKGSSGTVTTQGFNLIGDNTTVSATFPAGTPNANNDYVGTSGSLLSPQLASLGNNGGTTNTHALQAGSPAIDHGTNTGAPATDQRGRTRPYNTTTDIGAFEINPNLSLPATTLANGTQSVAYNQSLNNPLGGTAPYNFALDSGSLPAGITLSSSGTLSGTPTVSGMFNISVTVTDATSAQGQQSYTLTITANTAPMFASVATPSRQQGSPASNSQIATVSDAETAAGSLTVTVTSANPSNGVTLSNLVNSGGTVTADIVAACGASNASFTLQVSDGTATATANLTVNVTAASTPTITTQPAAQTVCVGSTATFSVTASNAVSYQWRKNGINISGATSSSYTTPAAVAGDNGALYSVVITGACGTVTSSDAALTVNAATAITTQPQNQSACLGGSATFSVAATGTGLSYQWRKGGAAISGATASSYTIPSVVAGDAANYDVVVTGSCGTVTSSAATLTINASTNITTQPVNQTACAGGSATFTVAASGSGTLTYQWRKGGAPINGATSSSFTISPVTAGDAGSYDVVVNSSCGMATSAAATLTVNATTAISTQPTNQTVCAGAPASFSVAASGAGLSYQWRKGGVAISGATSATYNIASAMAADAAQYDVVVTGACGTVTSSAASLTVNATTAITTQPTNQSSCLGGSVSFSVAATGTNLTYQWRKGGVAIGGATSATYNVASVVAGDAASYDVVVTGACGTVTSGAATLTVNSSTNINTQPTNQTACAGGSATFTVAASGSGTVTYQWRKGGVAINGATSASFTINPVAAGDAGSYDVVVSSNCGTATSSAATLTVNATTAITAQPSSQTVCAGAPASFSVAASGTNLSYQWRKGGVAINGATSSTFNLAATTAADAGSYDVMVTGACGAITSSAAGLTINAATTITTQPTNQSSCLGGSASFSVAAAGANLTYQWRKGGVAIGGATLATYTIASVAAGDAASYDVVVTGSCGTVTSSAATLTINTATNINTQPTNQTACAGGSATFTVVASGSGTVTYQWRKGGVAINGATNSSLTINPVAAGDAGSYDVVVTSSCGTATSAAASLTVNATTAITTQPVNQTVCAGAPASFSVLASGTNLSYQWRKGGVAIGGATSSTLSIASTTAADAGSYDVVVTGACGTVTSSAATLTVNATTAITTQPTNQSSCLGGSVSFSMAATGTGLSYQWRKGGAAIGGATSATYPIASVAAGDAASYDVVVTGACGTVTSSAATLTINAATNINTQPTNQTACAGGSATFTVAASGSGTVTYQWRKGGAAINGATSASFTINPVAAADAGSYDVVVGSNCGTATSTAATLTVNAATAISAQPQNAAVCAGAPAGFSVTAAGTNLTYQWRKGGVAINGATSATFNIASATTADAGGYDVIVTGACGTVTSQAATLTVNAATAITTQPTNQSSCSGSSVSFSVAATGTGLSYQWRKGGAAIGGATGSSFSIPSAAAGDAGNYDVVITSPCGALTSSAASLTVNPATTITTQPANQTKPLGQSVTFSVTANGLNLTYQWRKNGATINGATSGSYTIASVAAGDAAQYDVVLTGACGNVTSNAATLTVSCPTINLSSLPDGTNGVAYSQTVSVTPTGTYSFAVTSGSLPPGLALNTSTGTITGTPAGSGTFSFRIAATGTGALSSCSGSRDYSMTIACGTVALAPASLPNGTVGAAYNQTVSATPTDGYSFVVTLGSLPVGLTLNAGTGAITGTPTANGTFSFRITASTNAGGGSCSGSRDYTIEVGCATITLPALADATAGNAYSQSAAATPAGTYSYSITQGSLPSGLTLNPQTGSLSGTPSITGSYSFTIKAQDGNGCSGTRTYTFAVNCPTVAINPTSLPNGTLGATYNQSLSASPAGGSYTYAVTAGTLPGGLSLNPATGVLSGTPTASGSFNFTVTATGFGSCAGSKAYSMTISGGGCPTITLLSLPDGAPAQLYNNSVTASPSGSYSYVMTSGSLPPGLTLYGAFGLLYGYPTTAGTYNFTITATDANNCTGSQSYAVTISGASVKPLVFGDFDGDGKADLSVWRGQSGDWLTVNSKDGKLQAQQWGAGYDPYNDVMAPGDYDGDGKLDLAVFRRGTQAGQGGQWLIKCSKDGTVISKPWGLGTDIPVPGDYDGDGKTDIAVWRGSDTNWYILRSSDGQVQTVSWGTSDAPYRDLPVAADYDGDGKTDIAVFRQANGHWYIRLSSDGSVVDKAWGTGGDVPVAADYDGDGKADIAVWRGAETNWYILLSGRSSDNAVQTISWGTSSLGDVPVPGDYDGDGKADVAVWRASQGMWFVKCSQDGSVRTTANGQAGDTPVTAKQR